MSNVTTSKTLSIDNNRSPTLLVRQHGRSLLGIIVETDGVLDFSDDAGIFGARDATVPPDSNDNTSELSFDDVTGVTFTGGTRVNGSLALITAPIPLIRRGSKTWSFRIANTSGAARLCQVWFLWGGAPGQEDSEAAIHERDRR